MLGHSVRGRHEIGTGRQQTEIRANGLRVSPDIRDKELVGAIDGAGIAAGYLNEVRDAVKRLIRNATK